MKRREFAKKLAGGVCAAAAGVAAAEEPAAEVIEFVPGTNRPREAFKLYLEAIEKQLLAQTGIRYPVVQTYLENPAKYHRQFDEDWKDLTAKPSQTDVDVRSPNL